MRLRSLLPLGRRVPLEERRPLECGYQHEDSVGRQQDAGGELDGARGHEPEVEEGDAGVVGG